MTQVDIRASAIVTTSGFWPLSSSAETLVGLRPVATVPCLLAQHPSEERVLRLRDRVPALHVTARTLPGDEPRAARGFTWLPVEVADLLYTTPVPCWLRGFRDYAIICG